MRIGIIGTRGIPNQYGGFEQAAEQLAPRFVKAGHEVMVFSTHNHPYQKRTWKGVEIVHMQNRESRLGPLATIMYDRACVRAAVERSCDVVLALGYTPASLFFPALRRAGIRIVTNMDGLEWRRSKWSPAAQRFIRWNERLAVQRSDRLIADNPGIQDYLMDAYGAESEYAAYGAETDIEYDDAILGELGLSRDGYDLVVARLEPENSIGEVVTGHLAGVPDVPLVVIGGTDTPLGRKLTALYEGSQSVRLVGSVYNQARLNSLRRGARVYLHGHTVGGTNPSLLEAIVACRNIWIQENSFNRYVVGPDAVGFQGAEDLAKKLRGRKGRSPPDRPPLLRSEFTWDHVAARYLAILAAAINANFLQKRGTNLARHP